MTHLSLDGSEESSRVVHNRTGSRFINALARIDVTIHIEAALHVRNANAIAKPAKDTNEFQCTEVTTNSIWGGGGLEKLAFGSQVGIFSSNSELNFNCQLVMMCTLQLRLRLHNSHFDARLIDPSFSDLMTGTRI